MSEEPSQTILSKITNLFRSDTKKQEFSDQPNDEQIQELIENVLKIKGTVVKEIMIPEVNISSIAEHQNLEDIFKIIDFSCCLTTFFSSLLITCLLY